MIAGGLETIKTWKPVILMENNRPESDAQLLEFGYEPYAFATNRLLRGQSGRLNTFYIHPERRSAFLPGIYAE